MASPLKALADYVYIRKKKWKGIELVVGREYGEPFFCIEPLYVDKLDELVD